MAWPEFVEKFANRLGFPANTLQPIGILEVTLVLLCAFPRTAVLGAVLLTGYLGGAIVTRVCMSENFAFPLIFGGIVWLSIYLREPCLHSLLPFRLPARNYWTRTGQLSKTRQGDCFAFRNALSGKSGLVPSRHPATYNTRVKTLFLQESGNMDRCCIRGTRAVKVDGCLLRQVIVLQVQAIWF